MRKKPLLTCCTLPQSFTVPPQLLQTAQLCEAHQISKLLQVHIPMLQDNGWVLMCIETVLCAGLQTPPKGICAFGCSIALAESSRILTYMCCDELFSCVFFNFLFVSCVRIYSSPKQEETHWHLLTSLLAVFLIFFMNPSFITCERESILILST